MQKKEEEEGEGGSNVKNKVRGSLSKQQRLEFRKECLNKAVI